ncbi:MAG: class I SAM-dependent methyltransferase [Candidatus Aminicenantes bacterium]|nr:class I SAM-dependent methyltransferase [Candidatus Aminicenantes bacterium]
MTKKIVRKRWAAACLGAILSAAFLLHAAAPSLRPAYQSESRDKIEQPEKVMEATGVKPGMIIGEVGAGRGYFTFWLARGVGGTGKIYANDIDSSALSYIERRYADEKIANIETVLGTVDDPRLPLASLDMVFMVNAFHDLERPVELLANLRPCLKPDATVVLMDRDPARFSDTDNHFLTRAEVEETVGRSVFELVRVETFLRDHNLYILRARRPS